MHSIRIKITAIAIAAILISILSVSATGIFTIRRESDRSSVEMMNLIARDTEKELEKYLESIEQSVEMAANLACDTLDIVTLIENGAVGTRARQEQRTAEQDARLSVYLASYCARIQEAFSSVATHTQGIVTYYYCINPEISETEHGFFYSRVGKTGFAEREPLDARTLDPADIEHTTWYYTPIQRGRPSWVGPYTAHFLGEMLTYSYLVPIYKSGSLIGVLGMDIPFSIIIEQVSAIRVYDTGYACLFSADGRVLCHPEMAFGTQTEIDSLSVFNNLFRSDSNGDELLRYTIDGEERQMSFTTLSNGLKLAVVAPTARITASWIKLLQVILIITGVAVVVFSMILLVSMRLIIRPLRRLTDASQQLAAGDYDVKLDYRSQDEVGKLTQAFNSMRDQLKLNIEDLNHQVLTNALTGLPNMLHFFHLVTEAKQRMEEEGKYPVLVYFNLIGLKYYNRQYGFSEGDRLIREFADLLARHYGAERVGHFGQDHFAALTDESYMEAELRAILRECQGIHDGSSLPVRAGIYQYRLGDVEVSTACDRAKYACDQRRGSFVSDYCFFDTGMLQQMYSNRYIISHFEQAMEEEWIQVYYQPIIRAANGCVCDEEALARWKDPEKGMLSPAEFIPILENARLIYKLDLYVLEHVLTKMKTMRDAGYQLVPQSINLSREDFDACDIVEEVCSRVDASGIPREKITIEVTESTIGGDFNFMKHQVQRFQSLGFQVWMDDFGSGYSALDVLQDIHFDLIKFDMRFMHRFGEGDETKIILTELIKMAISLGLETIVEGVETPEQVDFLREIGCTKLQGYYYCKPIPMESIIERYKKGVQIGFENQAETGYYTAIGRINLYDLNAVASDSGEKLGRFFDTLPMAVIEMNGDKIQIVRCNKSYRDFMSVAFGGIEAARQVESGDLRAGLGGPFAEAMAQCSEDGARVFIHEELPGGAAIHAMLRHVAVNPVTGVFSCVAVVLAMVDAPSGGGGGNPQKKSARG